MFNANTSRFVSVYVGFGDSESDPYLANYVWRQEESNK